MVGKPLFALLLTVGLVAMAAPSAQAATTYEVLVGSPLGGDIPAEEMAFLPGRINVHQGDSLHFTTEGFHTATALPEGEDASDWIDENASSLGQPYFLAQPDPDDGAISAKYNFVALLPSSFLCGPTSSPCQYDGTGVVNSGAPLNAPMDFAVEVDAAPDSAFWFLCLVHPSMRMRVHVVANAAEASDQAAIDEATAERLANDHDDALALHNSLKNRRSFHKVGGKKVWDAWSGFDTKRFSLLDMYPHKLTVDKGDKVRWHFGQLQNEIHTVSLPKANALAQIVNQDFIFACDPDGDTGPGPDNPPDQEGFPFCSNPAQMEIDTADLLFPAFGNGVWTAAADLEHSGVRGAIPLAPTDDFYTLKMNNKTGKKGIPYICAIHSFMEGHVRVK